MDALLRLGLVNYIVSPGKIRKRIKPGGLIMGTSQFCCRENALHLNREENRFNGKTPVTCSHKIGGRILLSKSKTSCSVDC